MIRAYRLRLYGAGLELAARLLERKAEVQEAAGFDDHADALRSGARQIRGYAREHGMGPERRGAPRIERRQPFKDLKSVDLRVLGKCGPARR